MNLPDNLKGYRTVIFNLVMFLAMLVTLITGSDRQEEAEVLTQGALLIAEGLVFVWAIGSVWLRAITDSPVFTKKK